MRARALRGRLNPTVGWLAPACLSLARRSKGARTRVLCVGCGLQEAGGCPERDGTGAQSITLTAECNSETCARALRGRLNPTVGSLSERCTERQRALERVSCAWLAGCRRQRRVQKGMHLVFNPSHSPPSTTHRRVHACRARGDNDGLSSFARVDAHTSSGACVTHPNDGGTREPTAATVTATRPAPHQQQAAIGRISSGSVSHSNALCA